MFDFGSSCLFLFFFNLHFILFILLALAISALLTHSSIMSLRHGVRLLRPPGSTANPMNICRQTHRILTRSRHFSCSSYVSNSNASSQLLFPNQVRPSLRSQGTVNPNYSQFKSLVTINSNLSDSLKKNEIISDGEFAPCWFLVLLLLFGVMTSLIFGGFFFY